MAFIFLFVKGKAFLLLLSFGGLVPRSDLSLIRLDNVIESACFPGSRSAVFLEYVNEHTAAEPLVLQERKNISAIAGPTVSAHHLMMRARPNCLLILFPFFFNVCCEI